MLPTPLYNTVDDDGLLTARVTRGARAIYASGITVLPAVTDGGAHCHIWCDERLAAEIVENAADGELDIHYQSFQRLSDSQLDELNVTDARGERIENGW